MAKLLYRSFVRNMAQTPIGQFRPFQELFNFVILVGWTKKSVIHVIRMYIMLSLKGVNPHCRTKRGPASPAAGCTHIRLNGPLSRSRAFITQLSATPPARHRLYALVACWSQEAISNTVSSSTTCSD